MTNDTNTFVCTDDLLEFPEREIFSSFTDIEHVSDDTYYILKHSNTCPISLRAYNHVHDKIRHASITEKVYLLVVQEQRELSNKLSEYFDIKHESPQLIKVINGKVEFVKNHLDILSA